MNLPAEMMVAAAVNDRQVLENCLLRSPEIASGVLRLEVLENYASASVAYNEVLRAAQPGTIIIFAHQDVYLPAGYSSLLRSRIKELEEIDPDWGAVGLSGRTADGEFAGRVWSTAANKLHQNEVGLPAAVLTADELLLVVKSGTGLLFDDQLPGFHLYGTDIIQNALDLGRVSYVIDAPAIHHDKPLIHLDKSYRKAYRYLQSKWRDAFAVYTFRI
jgi:hypothetical protein